MPLDVLGRLLLYTPLSPSTYWTVMKSLYENKPHEVDAFDHDLSLYEPIWVDPDEIVHVTGREWKPWSSAPSKIGTVKDGGWDINPPTDIPQDRRPYPHKFNQHIIYQSIENRFLHGEDWEDTQLFDWLTNVRDRDLTHIKSRFSYLDKLYQRILIDGYRTQSELFNKEIPFIHKITNEILVDIGRDEEILFVDGRHRLSMAKVLSLDTIPVLVLTRHPKLFNHI